MIQIAIVYVIVACAAAWVVWKLLLPGSWRVAARQKLGLSAGGKLASGCHDGCDGCAIRPTGRRRGDD